MVLLKRQIREAQKLIIMAQNIIFLGKCTYLKMCKSIKSYVNIFYDYEYWKMHPV